MCGSGTFAIEAAMIAANIYPGIYRKGFAFEHWPDFDPDLLDRIYNDDSQERPVLHPIIGCDISPQAIDIATANAKSAGVARYIQLQTRPLSQWTEAPAAKGIMVTNPPYGERISAPDMEGLYKLIGNRLKHIFTGWEAWIIGYHEEYFQKIGLAPSQKISLLNGALDCQLREYIIFEGNKREFRAAGGKLKTDRPARADKKFAGRDRKPFADRDRKPFAGKFGDRDKKFGDRDSKPFGDRKPFAKFMKGDKFTAKPKAEIKQEETPKFAPSADNPLALRRNPNALRSLLNREPSLPKQDGPIMRDRGWKRRPLNDSTDNKDQ